MALTPEDVVKKEFSKPKGFGRNGYDEIQVDDFLDEIVVELRRLNAENDSLSDKLDDCRRSHGGDGDATVAGQSKTTAVPALTPVNNAAAPAAGGSSDEDKAEIARLKKELETSRTELDKARAPKANEAADAGQDDVAVGKQPVELVEEGPVGPDLLVRGGHFFDDGHQGLGYMAPAVDTEVPVLVGFDRGTSGEPDARGGQRSRLDGVGADGIRMSGHFNSQTIGPTASRGPIPARTRCQRTGFGHDGCVPAVTSSRTAARGSPLVTRPSPTSTASAPAPA